MIITGIDTIPLKVPYKPGRRSAASVGGPWDRLPSTRCSSRYVEREDREDRCHRQPMPTAEGRPRYPVQPRDYAAAAKSRPSVAFRRRS
jgi:hypothetical protein